jgi:hypothetical protein
MIDDCPVRVQVDGKGEIFWSGEWQPFDPWELISEGTPLSFNMFEERWPGLVSRDEFLASFRPQRDASNE